MSARDLDVTLCDIPKPPMGSMAPGRCAYGVGRVRLDECKDEPHPKIVEISEGIKRPSHSREKIRAGSEEFDRKTCAKSIRQIDKALSEADVCIIISVL